MTIGRLGGLGAIVKAPLHAVAAVLFALVLGLAMPLSAQDPPPAAPQAPVVDSVVVIGNHRLKAEEITNFSGVQLFQPINFRTVQRAIAGLYATGQFDDVRVDGQEVEGRFIVTLIVKERPILQRWSIRGVEKLEESAVRKKVSVLEGRPIDRVAVARSRAAIDSLYKKRGYYASVTKVVENRRDTVNAVDVVFDIKEGGRVAISQVLIEGNEKFKDKEVVAAMSSRPEGFWWFRKGEYSEEKVEDDLRNKIPQWYANRGHVDLRVLTDTLIADSTPGKAILKITLDEGKPYKVGNFDIVGNRRFSSEELSLFFPFGTATVSGSGKDVGAAFSRADWEAATEKVRNIYSNNGYITSSVEPEEVRRTGADGKPMVDLRWRVFEGQPATISKIVVVGNDVTHERVIREQNDAAVARHIQEWLDRTEGKK